MKTQVNKLKSEQAFSNKVVFFYLLIFGIIAFSTSGKNFLQSISEVSENPSIHYYKNNPNSELVSMFPANVNEREKISNWNYIIPLKAELSAKNGNKVEMGRLDEKIMNNSQEVYQQMLAMLANIEEPELQIEDILSQLDIQTATFKANKAIHLVQKQNAYLNEVYKQKTKKVRNEIEQSHQLNKLLLSENESELDIEIWMTDGNFWKLLAEENRDVKQSLSEMYAKKNADVYEAIEMEMKLKNWGKIDSEEPLSVEAWMVKDLGNSPTPTLTLFKNEYLSDLAKTKIIETDEMIELIRKTRCCAIIEKEEPLAVELWMISERCWCPTMKQINHRLSESFALKDRE